MRIIKITDFSHTFVGKSIFNKAELMVTDKSSALPCRSLSISSFRMNRRPMTSLRISWATNIINLEDLFA